MASQFSRFFSEFQDNNLLSFNYWISLFNDTMVLTKRWVDLLVRLDGIDSVNVAQDSATVVINDRLTALEAQVTSLQGSTDGFQDQIDDNAVGILSNTTQRNVLEGRFEVYEQNQSNGILFLDPVVTIPDRVVYTMQSVGNSIIGDGVFNGQKLFIPPSGYTRTLSFSNGDIGPFWTDSAGVEMEWINGKWRFRRLLVVTPGGSAGIINLGSVFKPYSTMLAQWVDNASTSFDGLWFEDGSATTRFETGGGYYAITHFTIHSNSPFTVYLYEGVGSVSLIATFSPGSVVNGVCTAVQGANAVILKPGIVYYLGGNRASGSGWAGVMMYGLTARQEDADVYIP